MNFIKRIIFTTIITMVVSISAFASQIYVHSEATLLAALNDPQLVEWNTTGNT